MRWPIGRELFVGFGAGVREWFDPGIFGVVAFFLVSGYIVPASLERRGDVQAFWIGRLFRLYPLCAVVFVAAASSGAAAFLRGGRLGP